MGSGRARTSRAACECACVPASNSVVASMPLARRIAADPPGWSEGNEVASCTALPINRRFGPSFVFFLSDPLLVFVNPCEEEQGLTLVPGPDREGG